MIIELGQPFIFSKHSVILVVFLFYMKDTDEKHRCVVHSKLN